MNWLLKFPFLLVQIRSRLTCDVVALLNARALLGSQRSTVFNNAFGIVLIRRAARFDYVPHMHNLSSPEPISYDL